MREPLSLGYNMWRKIEKMENRAPKTDTILRKLVDEVEQSMQSIIRATNAAALPTGQDSELGSSDDDDYDDSSDDLGSLSISSLSGDPVHRLHIL